MPDFYFDVDVALTEVPVNIMSLIDDTDFKTRETAVAYNAAGMDLVWNFVTSAGVFTQTAVTPTTAGDYDWTHQGDGMYTIEIPASGGASINNDTEGYGWFTGLVTGVLPWRGPTIGFRDAIINDTMMDTGAPATAAQVGALSLGSGGVSITAESFTGTTIGVPTNTYTSTFEEDGTYHIVPPTGGALDMYYQFDIGGAGLPQSIEWVGYVQANNDNCEVYFYNWGDTAWEQVGTIEGANGTVAVTQSFIATTSHVGTGANLGKVRFRFASGGGDVVTNVATDRILVTYTFSPQSIGYVGGAVWLDTGASNTNTESYVDGTADNPVSTIAAAKTIADNLNLKVIHCLPGTSITLAATFDNFEFVGFNFTVALGGQSIEGTTFVNATITGIGTATTTQPTFRNCKIGAATIPPSVLMSCGIGDSSGTFTGGSAGEYVFHECFSLAPGAATPSLDFSGLGVGGTGINNRAWNGGASYTLDGDCTLSHEVRQGGGQTTVTGGGDVEIRGIVRSLTITLSASETVQFSGTCGPVTISGAATAATVNLYGIIGDIADTSTGSTVNSSEALATSLFPANLDILKITDVSGSGIVDSNLERIQDSASTLNALKAFFLSMATGTSSSGTATTMVHGALTQSDDHWNGATLVFRDRKTAHLVTDFDAATDTITFTPAASPAISTDVYLLIPKAEVEAVEQVFTTDTFAEMTGAPAATATLADKIGYLYMVLRNKMTVTASAKTFFDDAGTAEWSKSLTDDGTTYTENEGA